MQPDKWKNVSQKIGCIPKHPCLRRDYACLLKVFHNRTGSIYAASCPCKEKGRAAKYLTLISTRFPSSHSPRHSPLHFCHSTNPNPLIFTNNPFDSIYSSWPPAVAASESCILTWLSAFRGRAPSLDLPIRAARPAPLQATAAGNEERRVLATDGSPGPVLALTSSSVLPSFSAQTTAARELLPPCHLRGAALLSPLPQGCVRTSPCNAPQTVAVPAPQGDCGALTPTVIPLSCLFTLPPPTQRTKASQNSARA